MRVRAACRVIRLDSASHVELGFPYDFYENDMVKGLIAGGMSDKIDV